MQNTMFPSNSPTEGTVSGPDGSPLRDFQNSPIQKEKHQTIEHTTPPDLGRLQNTRRYRRIAVKKM